MVYAVAVRWETVFVALTLLGSMTPGGTQMACHLIGFDACRKVAATCVHCKVE